MHQNPTDRRWIRIGFHLGIGIFLAFLVCYALLSVAVLFIGILLSFLNIAVTAAFPLIAYAVLGIIVFALLIFIPAFTGKSLAQMISKRGATRQPHIPHDVQNIR